MQTPSNEKRQGNTLLINASAAAAYMLGGHAGLLLAVPPSNASPIWPAAGIALALGTKAVGNLLNGKLHGGLSFGRICPRAYP